MNLRTIWTLPVMKFQDRLKYTREELARRVAGRLPKRIKYWAAVLQMSGATTQPPLSTRAMDTVGILEIMEHMERPREIY